MGQREYHSVDGKKLQNFYIQVLAELFFLKDKRPKNRNNDNMVYEYI